MLAGRCLRRRRHGVRRRAARAAPSGAAAGGDAAALDGRGPTGEETKKLAKAFGEENGVNVTVQVVPKDLQTQFVTASQAGKAPDVVFGAHDWIGNLVQNGTIDPVQMTDETKATLRPTRDQGRDLQRPDLRHSVHDEEHRALPEHRPGAGGPGDLRGHGRDGQGAQGRRQGQRDRRAPGRRRTATPTTSTRSTPPAAATCSASAAERRLRPEGPRRGQARSRSRRSTRSGARREGRGRPQAVHHGRQHVQPLHRQEDRLPGLRAVAVRRPQEGRPQVRHLPGARLRRRQAGPAVRHRAGAATWPPRARTRRWRRSS